MKNIAVIGSTGSIGTQTLDVVRELDGRFSVVTLCCNSNIDLLEKQVREFRPKFAVVINENKALEFKKNISDLNTKVLVGQQGVIEACIYPKISIVLNAAVGIAGLIPTIECIKAKKDIALANKETLVTGGEIVMNLAKENGVKILPVDSEHSAIFQSLQGNDYKSIEKIILTASGGPFRGKDINELKNVTVREALNHPNWSMGSKITIDSASLMNKGLEVIEAKWLFDVDVDNIQVVVHPQSILHSAVQYHDGSIIGQMGLPDMKLPIQYALTYPKRSRNTFKRLDIFSKQLTFEEPDVKTFRCLSLAYRAIKIGKTAPVVLNGANEKAVELFLKKKIKFLDIAEMVEKALNEHKVSDVLTLDDIIKADSWSREFINKLLE